MILTVQSNEYDLHVQLYQFNTLAPADWLPDVSFYFNDFQIEVPRVCVSVVTVFIIEKMNRKSKIVNKRVHIVNSPIIIPSKYVREYNRIEVQVPRWCSQTFGGVVGVLLVQELSIEKVRFI